MEVFDNMKKALNSELQLERLWLLIIETIVLFTEH